MVESISWRDVIELRREEFLISSDVPKNVVDDAYRRMEDFLDVFEGTDMGQEKLRAIQEKYQARENTDGGSTLVIRCQSLSKSGVRPDGNIGINPEDPQYLAFIDQNTKQPQFLSLERILAHELMHAADPKLRFDNSKTSDEEIIQEEYAVSETDRFSRTYMPNLGIRRTYENMAGQIPDSSQGREGENGVLVLKVEEDKVREINEAIQSVDQRVRDAETRLRSSPAPEEPQTVSGRLQRSSELSTIR